MKANMKNALMAAAVAGLFAAGATHAVGNAQAAENEGEQVKCMGVNACKGQGACAGAGHACAGHNACKGQGFIKTTPEKCKEMGGKVG